MTFATWCVGFCNWCLFGSWAWVVRVYLRGIWYIRRYFRTKKAEYIWLFSHLFVPLQPK